MAAIKFRVFGCLVLVEKSADVWRTYYPGTDGKNRPADFVIPDFIADSELQQYLGDLFHENATLKNSEVIRLNA